MPWMRIVVCLWLCLSAVSLDIGAAVGSEFRWTAPKGLLHVDPHGLSDLIDQGLIAHVYEGLTGRNPDLSVQPALALSWQPIRADRWRFFLRTEARFHDGSRFDAFDVERSLDRARAPGSALAGWLAGIRAVRRVDRSTVDIFTHGPLPDLPERLTAAAILDSDWLNTQERGPPRFGATGPVGRQANGTGPFRLSEWQPNGPLQLEPWPQWWTSRGQGSIGGRGIAGGITRAVLYPNADPAARLQFLLDDLVDVAIDLPLDARIRLDQDPGTIPVPIESARVALLGMAQYDGAPFTDPERRRAVSLALDPFVLADGLLNGMGRAAGLVTATAVIGTPAALNKPQRADPFQARQLWAAQAGGSSGLPGGATAFVLDCPRGRYPRDADLCDAAAQMLNDSGIPVRANPVPAQTAFTKILSGQSDLFLFGLQPWTLEVTDPLRALVGCQDGQTAPSAGLGLGSLNAGGYCDPTTNRLIAQMSAELFAPTRHALAGEIFQSLRANHVLLPLVQLPLLWGRRDQVALSPRADGVFDLRYVARGVAQ